MIRLLLILTLLAPLAHAQTDAEMREVLIAHEGYRLKPYRCMDVWHVGIGHALRWNDSHRPWTREQVERAFTIDLAIARRAAQAEIPSFNEHPKAVRNVLIELAFQCGQAGLHDFIRFRTAIDKHQYIVAARELAHSRLMMQAPVRTQSLINVLTHAAIQLQ